VTNENVHINVQESDLVVSGLIVPETHAGEHPVHSEYGVGHFHRHFSLTHGFDTDKIEAKMKDGVLTLKLPKASAKQPRRIEIRAG
jgi:HSP20 family protein